MLHNYIVNVKGCQVGILYGCTYKKRVTISDNPYKTILSLLLHVRPSSLTSIGKDGLLT